MDLKNAVLAGYSYDNHGRLTLEERLNGVDTSYGYDAASRLTSMTHDLNGTSNDVTLTFGWNPAGQMVSRRMSNLAYGYGDRTAGTVNYDINGLIQIDEIVGGASFTYDDNGNLTGIGSDTHSYDDLNRLTQADGGTDLAYGADGQLDSLDGTARRFSYDGANVTAERNSAGSMAYRYVHAGGLGTPLMRYSGTGISTREFYLTDERGSVIAAANNSGNAAYINRYDEYGVEAAGNSGTFGYAGMMRLAGEGMTHNRNRAYNPGLGRFMQADPIGQNGGLNLYAYTGGDPVNFSDPLGLNKKPYDRCEPHPTRTNTFICWNRRNSSLGGGGARILGGLGGGLGDNGGGGAAGDGFQHPEGGYPPPTATVPGHYFDFTEIVCAAANGVSQSQRVAALQTYTVPMIEARRVQDLSRNFVTTNLGVPGLFLPGGFVITTFSDDGLSGRNVTESGHIFFVGTVTRTMSQSGNSLLLRTTGAGIHVYGFFPAIGNQLFGPVIFRELNDRLRGHLRGVNPEC